MGDDAAADSLDLLAKLLRESNDEWISIQVGSSKFRVSRSGLMLRMSVGALQKPSTSVSTSDVPG